MQEPDARLINSLSARMMENERAGKPLHDGLDEEELRKGLDLLRYDRTAAAGKPAKTPVKHIDPMSLFTNLAKPEEPKSG